MAGLKWLWLVLFISLVVTVSSIARQELEERGQDSLARSAQSAAPVQPAGTVAGVRLNGSQPLIPPARIWLSGEVVGLPSQSTGLQVDVLVAGRTYPAVVSGHSYLVQVDLPRTEAMTVVEARAQHVRFRSVLGSAQRLVAMAGSGSQLRMSEHSALRVSPYSTALSLVIGHALGGRDAESEAEFEKATRSAVNNDLEVIAYVLSALATGDLELPAPFANTHQFSQNRAAFRTFSANPAVRQAAMGYLFRQPARSPLAPGEQVRQDMLMLDGIAYDDIALSANDVWLLKRQPDGTYDLYEDDPSFSPNYRPYYSDGDLLLQPNGGASGRRYLVVGQPQPARVIERSPLEHGLRRLSVGQAVDVWTVASTWRELDLSSGSVSTRSEYRVFSAQSLVPLGWQSVVNGASWSLPWFCKQYMGGANFAVPALQPCDYVMHRLPSMNGQGSRTLAHLWMFDQYDYSPVDQPDGTNDFTGAGFTWSIDADQSLSIVNSETRTSFWRMSGATSFSSSIVYVSRGIDADLAGQVRVGLGPAFRQVIGSGTTVKAGGWRLDSSGSPGSRHYLADEVDVVTYRDAVESGSWIRRRNGQLELDASVFWESKGNAIFEWRSIGYFASGPNRYYRRCEEAMAEGAVFCAFQANYFRPYVGSADRYYGIRHGYQGIVDRAADGSVRINPLTRLSSAGGFDACFQGACVPHFVYPAAQASLQGNRVSHGEPAPGAVPVSTGAVGIRHTHRLETTRRDAASTESVL